MPQYYLDTSALPKRYSIESGSDFIEKLFQQQRDHNDRIYASILTGVEFCSAIRRKQRENKLSSSDATYIITAFVIESDFMIYAIDIDSIILKTATRLLSDYPLRAYDSIQLANGLASMQIIAKPANFYFVCDDERLCQAAEQEGLNVLRPRLDSLPV